MDKQNYELAFHVSSEVPETDLGQMRQDIESLITGKGGVISYSKEPERTRLSYPINHQRQAYFGYVHFGLSSPEEVLKDLDATLRLNNRILRYLIVKMPSDLQKGKDMLRQIKMKERSERKPKAAPKQVTEKEEKEIEKQLEEVIEKL